MTNIYEYLRRPIYARVGLPTKLESANITICNFASFPSPRSINDDSLLIEQRVKNRPVAQGSLQFLLACLRRVKMFYRRATADMPKVSIIPEQLQGTRLALQDVMDGNT